MELLETQDPEKKRLIESSERHKRAMEKEELDDFTMKSDKIIKNALIIGGSLALTFLVISAVSRGRKKKRRKLAQATPTAVGAGDPVAPTPEEDEDDEPSLLSKVGTQLLNQASLMLLDLARQKLKEYLASRKNPDEHS